VLLLELHGIRRVFCERVLEGCYICESEMFPSGCGQSPAAKWPFVLAAFVDLRNV